MVNKMTKSTEKTINLKIRTTTISIVEFKNFWELPNSCEIPINSYRL